jgi:hypothetical protein
VIVLTVLLLLPSLLLAWLLVRAFVQNRDAWAALSAGRRAPGHVLRDALALWSPLALAVLLAVVAANRLGAVGASLAYRLTAIDAWCEVVDAGRLQAPLAVPCTGLGRTLERARLGPSPPADDVARWTAARFRAARAEVYARIAPDWQDAASHRVELLSALDAPAVLGLETAPEDTPELVESRRALQQLLQAPTPPARGVFDMVRYLQERDARVLALRQLTMRTQELRRAANEAAYDGLADDAAGRLWLRHQLAHAMRAGSTAPDPAFEGALTRMAAATPSAVDQEDLAIVRRGALARLGASESRARAVLDRRLAAPQGIGAVLVALQPPRTCIVAGVSDAPVACISGEGQEGAGAALQLRGPRFRDSVRRSIDRWHDVLHDDAARRLGDIARGVEAGARSATETAGIAAALPTRLRLRRAACDWGSPGRCLANAARAGIEETLARAVARDLARFEGSATGRIEDARRGASQQVGAALERLEARIMTLRTAAHRAADRVFLLHDLLRLLAWLTLAFVVVKSFLYVLALELYHRDESASMGFDDAVPVQGEYRSGKRVTIDRAFTVPLITRKQLSNADNHVRLAPWPGAAPIARLWHRRYFLFTRGTFLSDADPSVPPGAPAAEAGQARGMVASAGGGEAIVEWRMQPGEEVVFGYRDFFGASENLRLRSEISLRLSSLLLGRIFFRIAQCPADGGEGRLLLKADVELVDQAQIRAVPPERMIAWNRHARFSIHSGRTAWTTLINGYTLVRRDTPGVPPGLIVVSSAESGSNLGTILYVKRIFTALF